MSIIVCILLVALLGKAPGNPKMYYLLQIIRILAVSETKIAPLLKIGEGTTKNILYY